MTEGLTKLPKVSYTPPIPAVDAIPAFAERWYLTASPKGMFYTFQDGMWKLAQGNDGSSGGGAGTAYRIPYEGGAYLFPPGAAVVFEFSSGTNTTDKTIIHTELHHADQYGVVTTWPDPVPEYILRSFMVTPINVTPPTTDGWYRLPPGTSQVYLEADTHYTGYPKRPGRYRGFSLIPRTDGGYDRYYQTFVPIAGDGTMYVPESSDQPVPQYVVLGTSPFYQMRVVNFPGAPYQPARPPQPIFEQVRAWDAGANSIATNGGDVYTKFNVFPSLGVKIGFYDASSTRDPRDPTALFAAFYCFSGTQGFRWGILDKGKYVVPVADNTYYNDTLFEIRRQGGTIFYYVDGVLVYRSSSPGDFPLKVGTSMYATGDFVL